MRRAAQKQSSRELASAGATTRVQNAAVQVGSLRPAFSQHARRRSQHLQSSTPSRITLDAPDLSSRGSEPMAGCRRSRVIAPSALASFCSPQIKLTAPVATENRIRAGADAAMGYPRFGMLDLLKLLGGLLVGLFRSHAAREAET